MNFIKVLFFILFFNHAFAYQVPPLSGPVVDQINLLEPEQLRTLESEIIEFKKQTSVQLQVLIASTLNDESIEGVAIQVFDQWKLGTEKKDNGILILIAPNQKKMRIEVGQGLEGSVPDIYAKRIASEILRPSFRQGLFFEGLLKSINALKQYILNGDTGLLEAEGKQKSDIPFWVIIIFFMFFFFVIAPILNRMNGVRPGYRSGWGNSGTGWSGGGGSNWGSGGGSGWGGGGGSSSGGGASGDW